MITTLPLLTEKKKQSENDGGIICGKLRPTVGKNWDIKWDGCTDVQPGADRL